MKRKFTKYVVIILAILLAELLHAYVQSFLETYLTATAPYRSVAISMITAVVVFYPAFHFISRYIKYTSKKYVEGAQKITRKRFLGLIIGFLLALFLLFSAFSQIWYHKNPLVDLKNSIESLLF